MRHPSPQTLAKYALTLDEYVELAGPACFICLRDWSLVDPVVDHEHVRGWKTMDPERRREYVRGIPCRGCNHFILSHHLTEAKAARAALYLKRYRERKA